MTMTNKTNEPVESYTDGILDRAGMVKGEGPVLFRLPYDNVTSSASRDAVVWEVKKINYVLSEYTNATKITYRPRYEDTTRKLASTHAVISRTYRKFSPMPSRSTTRMHIVA